ncbi:tRNA methyltransferase 10 [Dermatophagoides pteronyssinus]|uniref:tRNA (guanine(9)-N(1))-methyltransferase n=1 Tax=Dermatophagoides pteronyssinus TaxID=6956 RepID=A0ABQ8J773_DERPT|nr:tRNA methyltransferase 10 [Dermatophagoides pteronyssinus]
METKSLIVFFFRTLSFDAVNGSIIWRTFRNSCTFVNFVKFFIHFQWNQMNLIQMMLFSIDSSNDGHPESNSQLSKRKQRRLKREQRWAETRAERRREEKKRRRERRQQNKLNGTVSKKPRLQTVSMSNSNCKTIIVIDCDYESFMNENELRKLCKQLMYCYAINRRSSAPAQLWITSMRGKLLELMERLHHSYHNWDCKITDKHWTEVLFSNNIVDYKSNPKIIYLTGDAKATIPDCQQIKESNDYVFIIGGLIDHNRHKCLCLKRAREEFQMNYGQLPIGEHIQMNQRRILSIPHVYEIINNEIFFFKNKLAMKPKSLAGENFTIGFRNDLPYNWMVWNSTINSFQIQSGIESQLIKDLATFFNFSYHLANSKDSSHDSLLSKVEKKEFDIGLGGFAMTYKRQQSIDFLYPYVFGEYTFMMARNKEQFDYKNIIRPFELDINTIQKNPKKLSNLAWISFNLLFRQPYHHLGSITISSKIFIILWAMCIVIIINYYCCFLLSTLTIRTSEQIQTVKQMTDAISAGKVLPIGVNSSVAQQAFYSPTKLQEFKTIRENYQPCKARKMCMELLMKQIKKSSTKRSFFGKNGEKQIAVIGSRDLIRFDQLMNGPDLLYIPPRKPESSYFTYLIAIPVRNSFPYKQHFNRIIGILQDAGILNHYRSNIEMDTDWNRLGINMTKVRRIILEKDSYKKDDNIIFDFKLEHFKYHKLQL